MGYILFDHHRHHFLPFTHTRAIADIRCGIITMRERWEKHLDCKTGSLTAPHIMQVAQQVADEGECTFINANVFATERLVAAITKLKSEETLVANDVVIAYRGIFNGSLSEFENTAKKSHQIEYGEEVMMLNRVWDIFYMNDKAIKADFNLLTNNRKSAPIPAGVTVTGTQFFMEESATILPGTIINATTGPVYIGTDAEIMEGCLIRGPFAMCDHSVLKMGAKIYGATTIGTGCKVGGENGNVVYFANSNKGHDGYLGNAIVGEWCNLGADTNASNLKNNYDEVKIWDEHSNKSLKTGLAFVGLMMGDHSKCGINTMFNTGTVVGVSCNIYGGDFPEKFIPSFSWGGSAEMVTYQFEKAIDTANRMMARRNKEISDAERSMLRHVFEITAHQRAMFGH